MVERLIVCQGTAQLVTAVAALRRHEAASQREEAAGSPRSRDHLLICGLAVDESQSGAFTDVIEKMAGLLHSFASISRLSDAALDRLLERAQRAASAAEIAVLLQRAT